MFTGRIGFNFSATRSKCKDISINCSQMSKKPNEYHIELFVKNPDQLSREEQLWVREWIEKDKEIQLLAAWYKEFFKRANEIKEDKKSREKIPPEIHLTADSHRFDNKTSFVLAADTPVARKSRRSVKTFISEKHEIIIRVIYDKAEAKNRLYVISEHVQENDIVLLKLENNQNYFFSKPGGIFEIPESVITKKQFTDFETCSLHLPQIRIELYRDSKTGSITYAVNSGTDMAGSSILEIDEEELNIDVDAISEKYRPDKIILFSGDTSSLWLINDGRCRIPFKKLESTSSLLFFYQ
jgi:hypothetical protein